MAGPLITPDVVQEAMAILDKHFGAAIGVLCGEDMVDTDAWQLALGLGLVKEGEEPSMAIMHNFGVFLAHIEHADGSSRGHGQYGTTVDEFLAAVEKEPVPRLRSEFDSSRHARQRAAVHLRGLGNKFGATLGSDLIEADEQLAQFMRQQVSDVAAARYGDSEAADRLRTHAAGQGRDPGFYDDAYRSTIKRFRSDLGHSTGDWARDWDRVAQTEAQNAVNQGMMDGWQQDEVAQATEAGEAPRRLLVYKVPRPGACRHCIRLHTRAGYPRIYDISEVSGNGTNIGRKAADWQIIIGATHPYCACVLHRLPKVIQPPRGWTSGDTMPDIIDTDGRLK